MDDRNNSISFRNVKSDKLSNSNKNGNINSNTNSNVSEMFTYTGDHTKFVLVMVGLPARGKSFIARKIRSYLSWLGIDVEWFNIGQYRRLCAPDTVGTETTQFFDPKNEISKKRRELFALLALAELETYLVSDGGQVGILDGTNSTQYRRNMIRNFFVRKERTHSYDIQIVFIESICTDSTIIEQNILNVKLKSPDYVNVSPDRAIRDFKERIKHYQSAYVTVDENDGSYIKLFDAGKKVIGHEVRGYLPSRILYFLMHLNLAKAPIFMTRHGESQFNLQNRIGGDSELTSSGKRYSKSMADFMSLNNCNNSLVVWCSTMKRCVQTAKAFDSKNIDIYQWRALCEIEAGSIDSLTYKEFSEKHPNEYSARRQNKLHYRYQCGESYKDVIRRLEPVIFELERSTTPVLVVSHRAVLRCLYGYFMDKPLADIPDIPIDLHTVYKLSANDYLTDVDVFTFGLVSSKPTKNSSSLNENKHKRKTSNSSVKDGTGYLGQSVQPKFTMINEEEKKSNDNDLDDDDDDDDIVNRLGQRLVQNGKSK